MNTLGKKLQPLFFRHWKGYPNAPFAFEKSSEKKEIQNLMVQAMRRTDRYFRLKKDNVSEEEIYAGFPETC